jgi:hypothetical protein
MNKTARQFVQYAYVGILVAFFLYYNLFSGNWDYFFSGAWSRDDTLDQILMPGFYLFDRAIPIPKLVAVPLTLAIFTVLSYFALSRIEMAYRTYLKQQGTLSSRQKSKHTIYTLVTIFSFWFFFTFAGRPILNTMPTVIILGFNAIIILAGGLWSYRTLGHTQELYEQKNLALVVKSEDPKIPPESMEQINLIEIDRLEPQTELPDETIVKPGNNRNRSDSTQTRQKS